MRVGGRGTMRQKKIEEKEEMLIHWICVEATRYEDLTQHRRTGGRSCDEKEFHLTSSIRKIKNVDCRRRWHVQSYTCLCANKQSSKLGGRNWMSPEIGGYRSWVVAEDGDGDGDGDGRVGWGEI
ncbi:hypothetical protein ACS0TY_034162 [Phlomoides rotata]